MYFIGNRGLTECIVFFYRGLIECIVLVTGE